MTMFLKIIQEGSANFSACFHITVFTTESKPPSLPKISSFKHVLVNFFTYGLLDLAHGKAAIL